MHVPFEPFVLLRKGRGGEGRGGEGRGGEGGRLGREGGWLGREGGWEGGREGVMTYKFIVLSTTIFK